VTVGSLVTCTAATEVCVLTRQSASMHAGMDTCMHASTRMHTKTLECAFEKDPVPTWLLHTSIHACIHTKTTPSTQEIDPLIYIYIYIHTYRHIHTSTYGIFGRQPQPLHGDLVGKRVWFGSFAFVACHVCVCICVCVRMLV
jgi:hypothetical protein